MSTLATPEAIEYPSSDGLPMAETGIHVQAIILLHQALQDFFRDRSDVFIASDMFWFWVEGDKDIKVAPDVMVVPGVGSHNRDSFKTFEEGGAVPAVVFEMASKSTWRNDLKEKFDDYEALGVREYFLFDPTAEFLVPVLQGYRLKGTAYRRLISDDDVLESELGFKLRAEGQMLRLIDSATGKPIPTRSEAVEAERRRADALQAEVERLRAMLKQQGHTNGESS